DPGPHGLTYPLYTSALATVVLSRPEYSEQRPARDAWLAYLRQRQLTEKLRWQRDDPQFGGWGYAKDPPARPARDLPIASLMEPNLSATVFALEALRSSGCLQNDPAIQDARVFVERCQNFSAEADETNAAFD